MADLSFRLGRDCLVISGSAQDGLSHFGLTSDQDLVQANLFDEETLKAFYRPYVSSGVNCIIANTKFCLKSVLAHYRLDDKLKDIAFSALKIVNSLNAQHPLVELGDTNLPVDPCSKNSILEIKNQYVDSARIFESLGKSSLLSFDGYFLTDINDSTKLKCALMGIRQVSDKPIIVDLPINLKGQVGLNMSISEYCNIVCEYGASVCGIITKYNIQDILKYIHELKSISIIPIMIDFYLKGDSNPFFLPDSLGKASILCYKNGATIFRASGSARASHCAVLSVYCTEFNKVS